MSDIDVVVVLLSGKRSSEFTFPERCASWPDQLRLFVKEASMRMAQPVAIEVRSRGTSTRVSTSTHDWFADLVDVVNGTGELPRLHR